MKQKIKKPQVFYQLVNSDGIPITISISAWYDSEITTGNNKNVHCNQGTVVRHIKHALEELSDTVRMRYGPNEVKSFKIDDVAVTKEEMIDYLLNAKIQVLRPAERLDLTFYLDKIK